VFIYDTSINTLIARYFRQLIGQEDWFLSHWDSYSVISLKAVACSSCCRTEEVVLTSGGIKAYLSGQLASFGASALFVGSSGL